MAGTTNQKLKIMKQIEVNITELIPAFIDDKNVMSDWVVESLFDGGNYVWDKNEAMGFIGGFPSFASYGGRVLVVRMIKRGVLSSEEWSFNEIATWHSTIVEHLTGNEYKNYERLTTTGSCIDFLSNDTGIVMRFCFSITGEMTVFFCYNQKK